LCSFSVRISDILLSLIVIGMFYEHAQQLSVGLAGEKDRFGVSSLNIFRNDVYCAAYGSPENAGPDIDGPRKIQGLTLQDLTMADQTVLHFWTSYNQYHSHVSISEVFKCYSLHKNSPYFANLLTFRHRGAIPFSFVEQL